MDFNDSHNVSSEIQKSLIPDLQIPSLQQNIFLEELNKEITIIRDDLIHPIISGNKWRKINYHLKHYFQQGYKGIASIGGAYSNHLHALAFVCHQLHIPCTLWVYGWHGEMNSATLFDCKNWNANLIPITRQQASSFRQDGLNAMPNSETGYLWIPEGGGGFLGEQGIKDLVDELPMDFDQKTTLIVCASGTGTTIQGILNHTAHCKIATHQLVKMANYSWINNERIQRIDLPHSHSFAKSENGLKDFIEYFTDRYNILLDFIYTAPLMCSFLQNRELHSYKNIYFIHTGGLQGNRLSKNEKHSKV